MGRRIVTLRIWGIRRYHDSSSIVKSCQGSASASSPKVAEFFHCEDWWPARRHNKIYQNMKTVTVKTLKTTPLLIRIVGLMCLYDCPSVLSVPILPGARTVTKGAWPCQAAFKPHHDQHGSQQAGGQDIYTVYISLIQFVCAQFSLSSWIWHWRRSSPQKEFAKVSFEGYGDSILLLANRAHSRVPNCRRIDTHSNAYPVVDCGRWIALDS